jgi:Flp pilus assembly protein TadB
MTRDPGGQRRERDWSVITDRLRQDLRAYPVTIAAGLVVAGGIFVGEAEPSVALGVIVAVLWALAALIFWADARSRRRRRQRQRDE